MNEVNVKTGTVVNGITIESHRAMQVKIANLTMENDELKKQITELEAEVASDYVTAFVTPITEPSIPDWIAKDKWVCAVDYPKYGCVYKISEIDGNTVYYKGGGFESVEYIRAHRKPFTPPPCPELPKSFFWFDKTDLKRGGIVCHIDGWIAMMKESPNNWCSGELELLLKIRDHIEKWGTA